MDFRKYGSQVLEWLEGIQKNRGISNEMTLELCDKLREYGESHSDKQLLGYAYYYSGETYYLQNDVEKLFRSMSRSLSYLEDTRQFGLLTRAYNILAITSVNRGNAPFAMDYYLSALKYCKRYSLNEAGIMIYINIGTLYNSLGESKQAIHYFDKGYSLLKEEKEIPGYHTLLMNIYVGMGNSYLDRGQPEKANQYVRRAVEECSAYMGTLDRIVFTCFEARVYHVQGKTVQRDACIELIQEQANENMPILDIFDDMYAYCEMLFDICRDETFCSMLELLERVTKQAKVINLQKRLLVLKIRYYKLKGSNAEYLQASGYFFELCELLEKENHYMVTRMIETRDELEESNQTKQKVERENRMLLEQSQTDALTGIANRYRLNSFAEQAFEKAVSQKTPLAIEILDIDYFKQYNDNYGHQSGDECIRMIAKVLQNMENFGDIFCARYGGDEFIVIYEGYTREEVQKYAENLKDAIVQLDIEHRFSLEIPVITISQGICCDIPGKDNKAWDFLHIADTMLYRVKEKQRNSICVGSCEEE